MKSEAPIGPPPPRDVVKPVQRDGWFATFTLLDVGGAISSAHVRRAAAAIAKLWRLIARSISDRSKSRVLGV